MARRLIALLAVLPACALYIEGDDGDPPLTYPDARRATDAPVWRPIDAPSSPIDAGPTDTIAYCGGDGVLYRTPPLSGIPSNLYTLGTAYATCPDGCQVDSTFFDCNSDQSCAGAAATLCRAPSTCADDGDVCTGASSCVVPVACAVSVVTETCTCAGGVATCEPSCGGGVCGDRGVGALLQGGWRGRVRPPSFSPPYDVTLSFADDHTYAADGVGNATAFYYGEDGASVVRRWRPIGMTPTGGVATVDVYFGTHSIRTALITEIRRTGTRLQFTFWDSWLDCSRRFDFDLQAY